MVEKKSQVAYRVGGMSREGALAGHDWRQAGLAGFGTRVFPSSFHKEVKAETTRLKRKPDDEIAYLHLFT